MRKKKIKMKRYKKHFAIILIICIIIAIIYSYNKNKRIEIKNEGIQKFNSEENEVVENAEKEEKQDSEENNKKIDFLENVKAPVYKKNEKDIKIPILIYHAFRTPIPIEEDKYKLFSSQANFEENVKTLLDEGYTFITLEELYKYNNGELALPEKVIIITMDDGWSGCYTEAYPVLQKYKIPATIFIVNKLMGTTDYFSWEEAKEMYDSGLVKIHCHGYSHIEYNSVSKERLQTDYEKSHQEIEEHLGEKIQKIMAYPAGKSNENTIKWLKEIGFEVQVQTKYGTVNKSNTLDLTGLGRIRAERATGKQILSTINSK